VKVSGNSIYVTTDRANTLALYSVTGSLINRCKAQAGATVLQAPAPGIYLLQVGRNAFKIVVK
jgi:hypothetical protein